LTLNQLVGGSNPLRPTRKIKHLWHFAESAFFVLGLFCTILVQYF
jgi:hypothetical protein